jgi:hypothetical protein
MRVGATRESKLAGLKECAGYASALARLEKLKPKLEDARKKLEIVTGRASSTVKHQLSRSTRVLPLMTDAVFDDMAAKIAANDGEIPEALLVRLRFDSPKSPFTDENDTEDFNRAADAARVVDLLARAVRVQERTIASEKKLAKIAIAADKQNSHTLRARRLGEAVINVAALVLENNAFIEDLRLQDESLPSLLEPGSFPLALTSDSAVCRWVASALQISQEEVQIRMATAQATEKERISK